MGVSFLGAFRSRYYHSRERGFCGWGVAELDGTDGVASGGGFAVEVDVAGVLDEAVLGF